MGRRRTWGKSFLEGKVGKKWARKGMNESKGPREGRRTHGQNVGEHQLWTRRASLTLRWGRERSERSGKGS